MSSSVMPNSLFTPFLIFRYRRINSAWILLSIIWITCTQPAKMDEPESARIDTVRNMDNGNSGSATSASPAPVENLNSTENFNVTNDTLMDDSLEKYFAADQIIKIKHAHREFENISNAEELASFYTFTIPTVCEIFGVRVNELTSPEMGDISPLRSWSWFTAYLPLVRGDVLCLDCTYSVMNDIEPLIRMAKKTPEAEDDLFFDLAVAAFGGTQYTCARDFFYAKGWTVSNECDICEASVLGDGRRMMLIEKLKKAKPARGLFGSEMDRIAEKILNVYSNQYLYSKEQVLNEIEKMLNSKLLEPEEQNRIFQQVENIKAKSQFKCSNVKACQWG